MSCNSRTDYSNSRSQDPSVESSTGGIDHSIKAHSMKAIPDYLAVMLNQTRKVDSET